MPNTELSYQKPTWCKNCLSMSTRPRISFDSRGWCNACRWMETKKTLDWDQRGKQLKNLLDKHRRNDGRFDCLVPASGGKDGSYVAYNLKHKYGMHPLCVTVTPPLPLELGEKNLRAFVESGYNHMTINPAYEAMRLINRQGFIDVGFPYYGWLMAIFTTPLRVADHFGINLIFYGEDGEVEYGGTNETEHEPIFDIEYMKKVYLSGGYTDVLSNVEVSTSDKYFFNFPEISVASKLDITHWSYFENWDPYRNYLVAKEHCGLSESETNNSGTFTNFAQNDQALYALHTYIMFLKFGFGRANQDASIEVRRGAMHRDQAVMLVKLYDGQYPAEFLDIYQEYFKMSKEEFDLILDKWANKDLLFKDNEGVWRPKFEIE